MPNLSLLYEMYGAGHTIYLLNRALEMAEKNPDIDFGYIQTHLEISTPASNVIYDWLVDNYKSKPRMSNHWVRCGRMYVVNNENTSLEEMTMRISIGNRTAFLVMLELEKKGYIKIRSDFTFERLKKGTDFAGFERQIKKFAKKYRGRCEPELLARVLFIDYDTAFMWAIHGRNNFGYVWRGKWRVKKKL